MRVWINFTELRKKLRFEDVLTHYGVSVRRKGEQHIGPCPLPNHIGSKSAPCFSANLERGIFQCFQCKASGNLLEFAALMARLNPEDGKALRKVAVELQTRFCPAGASSRKQKKAASSDAPLVNPPLDFELKGLDSGHPFFEEARLSKESVAHFGLGFCGRGLLSGRIATPLHGPDGKRVGYAGLAVEAEGPRWLFPADRERNGVELRFRKERLLFNAHRLSQCEDLVVVADIESVWRLHECGYDAAVATMSDGCSQEQAVLIAFLLKPDGGLWILSRGDEAGSRFAHAVVEHVAPSRFVRWVKLARDKSPCDLPPDELQRCFV